jgi:molybdate transport system ATP-binding protein|tara:strand:+ start:1316 stop:2431 length:1116 start_codon:yes stop_codon:yes gene_type:complete
MAEVSVEKRLGAFQLSISTQIAAHGLTAIFGRSGCGKTTLINTIAGLIAPDSGRIQIGDRLLFDSQQQINLKPEERRLGYVFQESRLFPHLSVQENLLYGYRRAKRQDRKIALGDIVDLLGVKALLARRPDRLSGGEKQRVALGRALLSNPAALLMDEPLAALDLPRKEEVLPFIEKLRDHFGLPILYVSHSMEEIMRLADSMLLISEGKLVAQGTVEELTSRLDLRPLTGRYEAGSVISARVEAQDPDYGMTALSFSGGRLMVPRLDLPLGTGLRLRIRAKDVSLALSAPQDTSIQNILKGVIIERGEESGAQVDILLAVGDTTLWSRVTKRSLAELGLERGSEVFALVKAAAIDRHSLGRGGQKDRFLE